MDGPRTCLWPGGFGALLSKSLPHTSGWLLLITAVLCKTWAYRHAEAAHSEAGARGAVAERGGLVQPPGGGRRGGPSYHIAPGPAKEKTPRHGLRTQDLGAFCYLGYGMHELKKS